MAYFKVLEMGHDTPEELEKSLHFWVDELGNVVQYTPGSVINVPWEKVEEATPFSIECAGIAAKFNACQEKDSLKYIHYIQGFPPEDSGKMTREQCHTLGVRAARDLWGDFPVFVITHYDHMADMLDQCYWHNHFIVYNCAVTDGHKLDTSHEMLLAQKRYIAAQADNHGLTRKGLILENGRIRETIPKSKIESELEMLNAQLKDISNKLAEIQAIKKHLEKMDNKWQEELKTMKWNMERQTETTNDRWEVLDKALDKIQDYLLL